MTFNQQVHQEEQMMEERILKKVEEKRDEMVDLLRALIKIPSMTGEEGKAQEAIAEQYRKMKLDVDIWEPDVEELFDRFPEVAQYPSHWQHDLILPYQNLPTYRELIASNMIDVLNYRNRPNVVGVWRGTGSGRSLILNGHIDTVTVEPRDSWTHDPFGAELVDGTLYGRGASDDKGGLVSAIGAAQSLRELGITLRGDLILESVVNEEHAGNGTLACIARGYTADAAIAMESSENRVRISSYGGVYWGINLTGKVRHTKNRWSGGVQDGVSAIEKLQVVINSLLDLEADQNKRPVSDLYAGEMPFCLNIGRVWGGAYDTASAGECSLRGSIYFGPDIGSVKGVMDSFRDAVMKAAKEDPWLANHPPEVLFFHHDDAHLMSPDAEIVKALVASGTQALGRKVGVMAGVGANDCRHLVNQGKIPSVVFGPGGLSQSHSIDESVQVDHLVECAKALALTVYHWCR
jgi:acetylornithine deacetylase